MADTFLKSTRVQGYTTEDGQQGKVTLNPGAAVTVKNKDQANGAVMAQFTVGNSSTVAQGYIAYVCGMDGVPALPVYPQTVVTLETDSPFRVIAESANAAAMTIVIGQLFLRGVLRFGGAGAPAGGSGGTGSGDSRGNLSATGTVGGSGGTAGRQIP